MAIRFDAPEKLILGMIMEIIIGCDFVESNSVCILTERSISIMINGPADNPQDLIFKLFIITRRISDCPRKTR